MYKIMKRLRRLWMAVMLTGYCCLTATAADHKIVVIADPHVMPASLLTNPDNPDWAAYIEGSRKLMDYSQSLFDQAVAEISIIKPELVLLVGDLTKDGEQASHDYIKEKLDELKAAGIQTLVIPGNHDLGPSEDALDFGETTTEAPTIDAEDFATLYADYGYGESSEREETSLTYACEPVEGLVVIGIDTGSEGDLSETTLEWVCDKAAEAKAAGKQVIAMMHHPLIPHITGGETFVASVSVTDFAYVRHRLAEAGLSIVFTGHFHISDIAKDWNDDLTKTIYDVTTGALCTYPCDYRIATLNSDLTSMTIQTESITSAGAPLDGDESFTSTIARDRLYNVTNAILKAQIMDRILGDQTGTLAELLAATLAENLAPRLAEAYIYHAEGNEHENPDAQSLLGQLDMLLSSYPAFQDMANSMLQDKSNYGDPEREDQTDDRSLSITLPKTTAISTVNRDAATAADDWYSLDGRKLKGRPTRKGVYVSGGQKIVVR